MKKQRNVVSNFLIHLPHTGLNSEPYSCMWLMSEMLYHADDEEYLLTYADKRLMSEHHRKQFKGGILKYE